MCDFILEGLKIGGFRIKNLQGLLRKSWNGTKFCPGTGILLVNNMSVHLQFLPHLKYGISTLCNFL